MHAYEIQEQSRIVMFSQVIVFKSTILVNIFIMKMTGVWAVCEGKLFEVGNSVQQGLVLTKVKDRVANG